MRKIKTRQRSENLWRGHDMNRIKDDLNMELTSYPFLLLSSLSHTAFGTPLCDDDKKRLSSFRVMLAPPRE